MALTKKGKIYLWAGIIILLLIVIGSLTDLIIQFIWLGRLGYANILWTIKIVQFSLFIIAFLIALLYTFFNIRYLSKGLAPIHLDLGQTPAGTPNILSISVRKIKIASYILMAFISLIFAFSASAQWNEFLRFAHTKPFGATDPIFGKDIAFYVFSLPFIETIQNSLILLVFFVTAILIIFHLASGGIALPKGRTHLKLQTNARPRKQILTNTALWLLLLAVGYFLDRYHLLFKHNDIIYGANYTDVHILIPVYWMMAIACILFAIYAFSQQYRYNLRRFVIGGISLFVLGILGQAIVPAIFQNFIVAPNELQLEKPFIKNNINYTRKAYRLDSVKIKKYTAADSIPFQEMMRHREAIKNVRIWDQHLTVQTYKQLQEIRLYYQFYNIDLDRYHTNKGYRQVLIASRELTAHLPQNAQTWVNQHLQYTHGFGIAMSPTTQKTEEGSPIFYIKNIPPESTIGLQVKQPAIYYPEMPTTYKLVNTKISELDYPKGTQNVYTHYQGKGGVPINNFFMRLLFAWHFKDFNILFTDYVQKGSKIQFWRSVRNRIHHIAPFLQLDNDPYIVLSQGRLYWMQDAYTNASQYPYAQPFQGQKNYIRNSVKVVVDAYQGTVNFYIANPNDPVLKVYQDIFPKLFKPLNEMPGTLKEHLKYPKDLFEIQLQKFSVFHMTDPQVFYNQEDLWESPKESYGGKEISMQPYYLLGMLPGSNRLQYMLISPMTPKDRDNMISWMVVKSDSRGYGHIIDYELPKEQLYLGPAQIEAKINQNTDISKQLSLWDQRGSQVIRGNLMVIPIENSFLYIEPVFLFSTTTNIPQLKRVIATTGSRVVMEPTLDEAIMALYGKTQSSLSVTTSGADSLATVTNLETKINSLPSPELTKLRTLWREMQNALQKQDWETFGKKMDEINRMLSDSKK